MPINPNLSAGTGGFGQTLSALDVSRQRGATTRGQQLSNRAKQLEIQEFIKNKQLRNAKRDLGIAEAESGIRRLPTEEEKVISANKAETQLTEIQNDNPELFKKLGTIEAQAKVSKFASESTEAQFNNATTTMSGAKTKAQYTKQYNALKKSDASAIELLDLVDPKNVTDDDIDEMHGRIAASIKTRQSLQMSERLKESTAAQSQLQAEGAAQQTALQDQRLKVKRIEGMMNRSMQFKIAEMNAEYRLKAAKAKSTGKKMKLADTEMGDLTKFVQGAGSFRVDSMLAANNMELDDGGFWGDPEETKIAVTSAITSEAISRWETANRLYEAEGRNPALTPRPPTDYMIDVFNDMLNKDANSQNKFLNDGGTLTLIGDDAFRQDLANQQKMKAKEEAQDLKSKQPTLDEELSGLSLEEKDMIIARARFEAIDEAEAGKALPQQPSPQQRMQFQNRGLPQQQINPSLMPQFQ